MDHNLDDTLNLDGSIGVDFEHSEDTVVNQADISLDASGHEEGIQMEYDSIEEQSMLMDTGNEEIIVSDFMGDQFTLQEYGTQEEQVVTTNSQQFNDNVMVTEAGDIMNLQFDQPIEVPASGIIQEDIKLQPKIITVQGSSAGTRAAASAPREVAIAPKPHKPLQNMLQAVPHKQFAIAPRPARALGKPLTLLASRPGPAHGNKGNAVLTLGKQQLVVMGGAGGGQKLKLVASGARTHDQAQLIQNVPTSQAQGNKVTKVIVHGAQADVNQPAVITKLLGGSLRPLKPQGALTKRVILASPSSKGVRYATAKKPQLVALQSANIAPAGPAHGVTTTKKVVIKANPKQNVILKATPKQANVTTVSAESGQKTQLHQINVPGKGIQYIRLLTNPAGANKAPPAPPPPAPRPVLVPPGKTFVLADGKGNLIQMTAEKVMTTQPPPLIVSTSVTTAKVSSKPPQKLVRLAPISSKIGQAAMSRGGQSILAPLSPLNEPQPSRVTDDAELVEEPALQPALLPATADHGQETLIVHEEEPESKSALRALIAETVGADISVDDEPHSLHSQPPPYSLHTQHMSDEPETEEDYARRPSTEYSDSNSAGATDEQHPLIVIPPYMKQEAADNSNYDNSNYVNESRRLSGMINVEVNVDTSYDNYPERQFDDRELVPPELGIRPRKACNCTKSQCLKLYCDCFANGEFCNNCNCNNCHNNLENEELRQKAIRGCLDRNPNAFRPKIGKSRAGGPVPFRRHNKGCNCKRSGCLKNYCECYEAKIACTNICKCVGCRNVEESLERTRRRDPPRAALVGLPPPSEPAPPPGKQPCSFMTMEVIEAVCQCLIAAAVESGEQECVRERDPVCDVIDEFARCLQDIISASHQAAPRPTADEMQA